MTGVIFLTFLGAYFIVITVKLFIALIKKLF
jgi:hypothetical protein